jgi:tRNA threonylcarbamoyl adenosine modification protein YeaZ
MRTLVIDTATRACSVALFDGQHCLAFSHEIIGRGHAEKLLPYIAGLPEKGHADQILVNIGPGSFTGIRVGVSAAKALAFAWQIEAHGYNCLALVAAMAADAYHYPVDVVMAGGHGEYFFQAFDGDGFAPAAPESITPHLAAERSLAALIAGDAAQDFTAFRDGAVIYDSLPNANCWSLISGLPKLPPRPFYGRLPDAAPAAKVVSIPVTSA